MMYPVTTNITGIRFKNSLERHYIVDYLQQRGYALEDLVTLNPLLAKEIMIKACRHASLKLAEIESTSQLIRKIHN